jgi:hypothetical protein
MQAPKNEALIVKIYFVARILNTEEFAARSLGCRRKTAWCGFWAAIAQPH